MSRADPQFGTDTPVGQPAHGAMRDPARLADGRIEGGYSQISLRRQRIRAPYTIDACLAARDKHLGLST